MKVSIGTRLGLGAFLLAGFVTAGAGAASAADGQTSAFTVAGYSYNAHAGITSNATNAVAVTDVNHATSGNVPAGYIGANARMFTSGGTEVGESGFKYTTTAASGIGVPYLHGPSGTYYSYGVASGYNGNGYNNYYTFKSPNQNH
jgi:hypothetical protein